jgi:MYXO-CTERM domain-containing protein
MFDAGADHWVRLDDDTGESTDLERSIVYDALRVTRLDGGSETTSDGDTGLDSGEGGGGTTAESGGVGSEGGPLDGSGSGGIDPTFALPDADDDGAGGCGCRGTGGAGAGWWLLLPGMWGLTRRRRR